MGGKQRENEKCRFYNFEIYVHEQNDMVVSNLTVERQEPEP